MYFFSTRPGWYEPIWPAYIVADDPSSGSVLVAFGRMIGTYEEREPALPEDPIERRCVVRETLIRVHQGRFRGLVMTAYRDQRAIAGSKRSDSSMQHGARCQAPAR